MKRHLPEYSTRLIPTARMLRKRMTDAEMKLWSRLRSDRLGVKFRHQVPLGPYIADFYCAKAKLDIELDGDQHYADRGQIADHRRDGFFRSLGIRVIRYRNSEIMANNDGVVEDILLHVQEAIGPQTPDTLNRNGEEHEVRK